MPIYEYRCGNCGHTLDALQKLSDAPLTDCPACQSASLRKLVSAPVFRLKGSGWYETDFKADKERRRNLAESADDSPKKADGDKGAADGADKKAEPTKKSSTDGESSGDSTKKSAAKREPAKEKGGSSTPKPSSDAVA